MFYDEIRAVFDWMITVVLRALQSFMENKYFDFFSATIKNKSEAAIMFLNNVLDLKEFFFKHLGPYVVYYFGIWNLLQVGVDFYFFFVVLTLINGNLSS